MFRHALPLALLLAVLVGCSKKKPADDGSEAEPEPSGPAYTIKLYDEKVGDKVTSVDTDKSSFSTVMTGAKGKMSKSAVETTKFEYTETILEMPAGAKVATKATREYKVAEKTTDGGPPQRLSYAGKTVLIEKKGGSYTFTVNGSPLPPAEAKKFRDTYEKADKFENQDMLPPKPVQVYEKWSLTPAVMKKLATDFPVPVNAEKSTGTGRLTKAYTKDGQQWGTIELKISLAFEGNNGGATVGGSCTLTMTLDAPIDASSPAGIMKMKTTGTITTKQPGVEVELQLDGEGEETRTPAK